MGRVEWLRALGITYRSMEENGIMLPVISLQMNFKQSALYDDLFTVDTRLVKMPSVKIDFDYTIRNEANVFLVESNTVLAFMDKKTKGLSDALNTFFPN